MEIIETKNTKNLLTSTSCKLQSAEGKMNKLKDRMTASQT